MTGRRGAGTCRVNSWPAPLWPAGSRLTGRHGWQACACAHHGFKASTTANAAVHQQLQPPAPQQQSTECTAHLWQLLVLGCLCHLTIQALLQRHRSSCWLGRMPEAQQAVAEIPTYAAAARRPELQHAMAPCWCRGCAPHHLLWNGVIEPLPSSLRTCSGSASSGGQLTSRSLMTRPVPGADHA